jgi:hypothetical protein
MPIPLGSRPDDRCAELALVADSSPGRTLIRKTSLLRIVPTACGQAADKASGQLALTRQLALKRQLALARQFALATRAPSACDLHRRATRPVSDARRLRIGRDVAVTIESRSDPSSSRCQITRTRISALRRRCGADFVSLRTSKPAGGARRDRTDDLLLAKQALSQLSYGPGPSAGRTGCAISGVRYRMSDANKMVGLGRLELPTSRLSSARSNQLSYKPNARSQQSVVSTDF